MQKAVGQIIGCLMLMFCVFFASALAQVQTLTINEKKDVAESKAKPNPALLGQLQDGTRRYRIGINDELDIQVFKHPEYSKTVRVSERGLIALPRIDEPIQALCKTENELAEIIKDYYKKYLRQPYVSVFVKEYKSQPIAVIGAVEKPGQFYINRKMRLLEALSLASGPSTKAGSRIQVARLGMADICQEPKPGSEDADLNLSDLLFSYNLKKTMEGDEASNPWMRPGDIVTILEADKAFVVGNVKEPKAINLREKRTLTQAIAEAGGILEATKKKSIFLIRQDGSGNKVKTTYDFDAIMDRKAEDPVLQPDDIIEVPLDAAKDTRRNIMKSLINGIPSVLPWLIL